MAGEQITITYSASFGLGAHPELLVRARFRTAESDDRLPRARTMTTLQRVSSGVDRGSFTLPDSNVYAAVAVEPADGSAVDDNAGRAVGDPGRAAGVTLYRGCGVQHMTNPFRLPGAGPS